MLSIPGSPSAYTGNYVSFAASTLKPPVEGNRTIPIILDWLRMGTAPNYPIHFNARSQQVVPISQIAALHVDNTRCSETVVVYFPDTQFEVVVPSASEGFYPVVTNGLEFFAWVATTPTASDETVVQVLNFLPPPMQFGQTTALPGTGSVTQVATGPGLTGGPITTSGTVSLISPVTIANGGTNATTPSQGADNLLGMVGTAAGMITRSSAGVYAASPIPAALPPAGPNGSVLGSNGTTAAWTRDPGPLDMVLINQSAGTLPAPAAGVVLTGAAADNNPARITLTSFSAGSNLMLRRSTAPSTLPTNTLNGQVVGSVIFSGYDGTNYSPITGTRISGVTSQDTSNANQGSNIQLWTTPQNSNAGVLNATLAQGLMLGAPTGGTNGDMGSGSLNVAAGLYVNGLTARERTATVSWLGGSNPAGGTFLLADRALTITGISGFVETPQGAASNCTLVKAAAGVALSAGTQVTPLNAFNANGTAGTLQSLSISVPNLAAGERLGVISSGAFTASVASISVTVQ